MKALSMTAWSAGFLRIEIHQQEHKAWAVSQHTDTSKNTTH